MIANPPKGYLFIHTDGKICMADGQGGADRINVVEILAEREQLRAEMQELNAKIVLLVGQRERAMTAAQWLRSYRPSAKKFKVACAELDKLEKEVLG
jgi:hypothetical protein